MASPLAEPGDLDADGPSPSFPKRRTAVLVGIGGLVAVGVLAITIGVPTIERHLRHDILRHALALAPSPAPAVDVDVHGRDVTLRGSVGTDSERTALLARVRARWGVAQVDGRALTVRRAASATPTAGVKRVPAAGKRVPAAGKRVPATVKKPTSAGAATSSVASQTGPVTSQVSSTIVASAPALLLDPTAPARLQATLTRVRRIAPVAFAKSSLTLAASSAAPLDQVAAAINNDRAVVRVEAHTDSSGDNVRNAALSQQRAEVVRLALIARGVAPELLIAVGRGEGAPIASNITARGRELNRRIEFVVNPTPTTTTTT